jgi:hypothetical protein
MKNPLSGIPELSRISDLLGSLSRSRSQSPAPAIPTAAPAVSPSAKLEKSSHPAKKVRPVSRDGKPFGSQEVGSLFVGLNWANDPAKIPSPLVDSRGNVKIVRGAVGLDQFFGLFNWNNGPDVPAWPVREGAALDVGTHSSVETVLAGFGWD